MGRALFLVLVCLVSGSAAAANGLQRDLPVCVDQARDPIGVNNDQVLHWKEESPNQYKDRALIEGSLVGVLLNRKSHLHLEVDLIPRNGSAERREHVEIVYNKEFGAVGDLQPGMKVVACGDYITARKQAGPYKPSPVGAIVHWVHATSNPGKHAAGFLAIGDEIYGLEPRHFMPWALFPF